jgi:hypothetical protein
LLNCAGIAATGLTAPAVDAEELMALLGRKRALHDISGAEFASQLNTSFYIDEASGRTVETKLAEVKMRPEKPVKAGRRPPPDAGNEKFSLFFSGSRSELVGQGTYSLRHRTLGRFDVFLVPISTRNPAKIDYQVVVSRPGSLVGKDKSEQFKTQG